MVPDQPVFDLGVAAEPIRLKARRAYTWRQGEHSVFALDGGASIRAGNAEVSANRIVLWFLPGHPASVDVYATGDPVVRAERRAEYRPREAYVRLSSTAGVVFRSPVRKVDAPPAWKEYRDAAWLRYPETRPPPPPDPPPPARLPPDLEYSADRLRFDLEDEEATLTLYGNVAIQWGEDSVEADAIIARIAMPGEEGGAPSLKSVYAEGAVTFVSGKDTLQSARLFLDQERREGVAADTVIRIREPHLGIRMALHLPEAFTLSPDEHFALDAAATTSMFGRPPWRIQARELSVARGEPPAPPEDALHPWASPPDMDAAFAGERPPRAPVDDDGPPPGAVVVSAKHSVFYAGEVPLFYWPYVSKDIADERWFLRSINVGDKKRTGPFLQTVWNLNDFGVPGQEWSESSLALDAYLKRGVGFGPIFEYDTGDRMGLASFYYIDDRGDFDEKGAPVPKSDRGRIQWRHREHLADEWRLDLEANYISDENFMRTYFREEAETGKEQETYAFLRRLKDNSAATAIYKTRLNDFQRVVERRPSVAYHEIARPVFDTDALWTHSTDVSNLRLLESETGQPDVNDGASNVLRFHTWHEVSHPLAAGPIQMEPFAETHLTAWNKSAEKDKARYRGAAGFGMRASANFHRTYAARLDALSIDRLRHIVTPTLEYRNLPFVSDRPDRYIQHDDVDALDKSHRLRGGLRNRWQTKRGPADRQSTVDFLVLEATQHAYLGSRGANAGEKDYLEVDAEWIVNEELGLKSIGNEIQNSDGRLRVANGQIHYSRWHPLAVAYHHDYYDLEDVPVRSVGTMELSYAPEFSRWVYDLSASYDFAAKRDPAAPTDRHPSLLGTQMRFTRTIHQWILSITLGFRQGRDDDTTVAVMLLPEGMAGRRAGFR